MTTLETVNVGSSRRSSFHILLVSLQNDSIVKIVLRHKTADGVSEGSDIVKYFRFFSLPTALRDLELWAAMHQNLSLKNKRQVPEKSILPYCLVSQVQKLLNGVERPIHMVSYIHIFSLHL